MKFEQKWSNHTNNALHNEKQYLIKSFDQNSIQKHVRNFLSAVNLKLAVNHFLLDERSQTRNRLSFCAMTEEYCFLMHNKSWPYWNMKPYTYALLSDNKALIDRFAHLPVDAHLIYESPKNGKPKHFNYAFQGLLRNNKELIQRGLDLFEEDIAKRKEIRWMRAHIACTEAVASDDQQAIEKALLLFEDNRIKSQAIKADICEEVLSFFPLAYAKIAWLRGIEVNLESKYLPVSILEVKPLTEYTIPYWFLRDFYREQDVQWPYSPLYPNLQKWENDPENPKN